MAEDEEEQGLLEDDQLNEFPVGSTWIIDNRGRKKVNYIIPFD
jgi:hypothetical protein